MLRITTIIFLSLFFLNSCSTPRPEGTTEAEVLFKEAQRLKSKGRYLLAIERLNTIRSKYPYSYYSTHAELLNADILFEQENYAEAAAAYIVFKDFHPKHKQRSYVLYRVAESFYNQLPDTFDRDLTPGYEAINYYRELLRIYGKSDYAKDAREKIKICEDLIKQKEQYIADFYFKTDVFDAAKFRYKLILDSFSDADLRQHSIDRLLKSAAQLGDMKDCRYYYSKYQKEANEDVREEMNSSLETCKEYQAINDKKKKEESEG
ncbi:MAG: outer membrane protein assembly factor BamD [Oligoflexia bacterium]|nr:outer membrane protein assembly factor BamD [Oligoflexia bacterium]